ncbi:MAG: HAMP domain-containing histidine kinase [Candidatus Falkowbacteria bacterium]|nr:MAG: HAMP domain-containing histidine kinase [Candidatus Falkowbacteria bacterium]
MSNLSGFFIKFKTITQKIKKLLAPKSINEEAARREQILNILIFFSIICFSALSLIRLLDLMAHGPDRGLSVIFLLIILGFFIFLFWLSKKKMLKTASWLLITIYSLPMFYSFIIWGADLPAALLMAMLIITFFGVLMGSRASLISASILSIFLIVLTNLQARGLITITNYWRLEKNELGDTIAYAILMMIITVIVWIFDNGLNKALKRAHASEEALKQERDDLEIKIVERTAQLRELEAEKIGQLYRLAEFGRLSSGVFHDLINPLTAVSLNLEQIKNEEAASLVNAKDCLSQAIVASHKMEDLIACIKRSIRPENNKVDFCPKMEIETVINILAYKARKAQVEISFFGAENFNIYGDPVKFSQIIINLISNGIDSLESQAKNALKPVNVSLARKNESLIITVEDQGPGIAPENINKIFQPFFSTKNGQGLGLGLSSTKNIIEKEFLGTIAVYSQPHEKTVFTVNIPLSYAT